jgi:hypothetical protein
MTYPALIFLALNALAGAKGDVQYRIVETKIGPNKAPEVEITSHSPESAIDAASAALKVAARSMGAEEAALKQKIADQEKAAQELEEIASRFPDIPKIASAAPLL